MIKKVASLCLLFAGCISALPSRENLQKYGPPIEDAYSQPTHDSYSNPKHNPYKEQPKPYAFDYGVRDEYTGANFGHQENSDGNAITGSYSVALPDGRIQKVNYVADHHNGFQAEVTYEGEAVYPQHQPEQPSYGRPQQYQPQQQFRQESKFQPQNQYKSESQHRPQQLQQQQQPFSQSGLLYKEGNGLNLYNSVDTKEFS